MSSQAYLADLVSSTMRAVTIRLTTQLRAPGPLPSLSTRLIDELC
jgi:hypothetical protein